MKKFLVGLLALGSITAQASACEVKLPSGLPSSISSTMEKGLKTKDYDVSAEGNHKLRINMNIDHRGHKYVIGGYTVEIEDSQRNVLSRGTARWKFFSSEKKVILKAFAKALKNLPECQN